MRRVHHLLILMFLLPAGCQSTREWVNLSRLFESESDSGQKIPWQESTDAWDGTWAEQP